MVKAICVSGEYNSLEIGKIYDIKDFSRTWVWVVGGRDSGYIHKAFAFINGNKPISTTEAHKEWRKERRI